jgi:hypothetical protein
MQQSVRTPTHSASRWGHWGRMAIRLLTMGFVFTHSSTEGLPDSAPAEPVKPPARD